MTYRANNSEGVGNITNRERKKTAVITGASTGIGFETALKFAENGYNIAFSYNHNADGAEKLSRLLSEKTDFLAFNADFTSASEVYRFGNAVLERFGCCDVLVNNAGASFISVIQDTTDEKWDTLFHINVKSAFILTKVFLPYMLSVKSGSVINISSIWGEIGASCEVLYSATKAAIIGYTKALSKELAPSGIRVNCIAPGVIDTAMNACFTETEKNDIAEEIPLGRFGKASEVAEAVFFLASPQASFITGHILSVNGGSV